MPNPFRQQSGHPHWANWPISLQPWSAIVPCVTEEARGGTGELLCGLRPVRDRGAQRGDQARGADASPGEPTPGKRRSAARLKVGLLRLEVHAAAATQSRAHGLEEAIMYQEEVVLYGVVRSRSCRRARRLLRRKGYAFEEVDVGVDEGLLVSLSEVTGKKVLLPLVFLGGRLVGGLDEIEALERSGDLGRLVRGRV